MGKNETEEFSRKEVLSAFIARTMRLMQKPIPEEYSDGFELEKEIRENVLAIENASWLD